MKLLRFLWAVLLACLTPIIALLAFLAVMLSDVLWAAFGRKKIVPSTSPDRTAASVVIPNWNGRDLLEKYLPSVVEAMSGNPRNEVIVVDNGSEDGSAEFLHQNFPTVRIIALEKNLGFGGGSNTGFKAATNDVVVLLNSDMRVAPDFLAPLLEGFSDPDVFAVSCQILFTDPNKVREETGLTQVWWEDGAFRVAHRMDDQVTGLFPCSYPGGGSSAFDRRKFLELGGFDELLRPFYGEDTDLGYLAWKRGWKVLYQPASLVWHEHRGTIGKKFSQAYIDSILQKNFLLLCWKNIHETRRITEHFLFACGGAMVSLFAGNSRERASLAGLWKALLQIPEALSSRWRARQLAAVSDQEALSRPLGGYFYDRFAPQVKEDSPRVLFLSPYPLEPPVHGGAVFMNQTIRELAKSVELHLVVLVDTPSQVIEHESLRGLCASLQIVVRLPGDTHSVGSIRPRAVREFFRRDLEWLLHRTIFSEQINVLQLEYTNMGQYAGNYHRIINCVFEHDVYFQSIERQLEKSIPLVQKLKTSLEYLRAFRWEIKMLQHMDRIQVCTIENGDYLKSFDKSLSRKIDFGLRAGIDSSRYDFQPMGRQPETMLFVGSFRHLPNAEALTWFAEKVMPEILRQRPQAKLIIVGAAPPPSHSLPTYGGSIEIHGFAEDIRAPFREYSVFICPILTGSGVRVKLLEAFASGIPVVSTRIGAEGLARVDGEFCSLADTPEEFARKVIALFEKGGQEMAIRARQEVENNWDIPAITRRLVDSYYKAIQEKSLHSD